MLIGISFVIAMACFISLVAIFRMNLKVSKVLHKIMINSVMKAPINLFFDITPTGNILTKFSSDL